MNIEAYLRGRKEHLGRESRQVKDFSVFDFNYIPDQPVMRDESRSLIDAMLRFEVTGIPSHQAVIGSRGSGKTLMFKFLKRIIPQQSTLEVLYANCREQNTSFKILSHLLGGRTSGSGLTELYERFLAKYRGKTVVVLDEVDLMSPKDKRREILYLLSRSERPYMVVMLSNNPHVLKQLDAATRSSLQPGLVHFKNYDAEQIRQILLDRAKRGLHRWEEARLGEIAALTVRRTNADARVAIKTLYYTVTEWVGDVGGCFEKARRDIVVDVVNDLSDANLMILGAVVSARSDLAKDVYDKYSRLSLGQNEKPFSYVHFYSNLGYLQSVGLIALVSTKVDRTYTNRILLTFEPPILESIYRLRFGQG